MLVIGTRGSDLALTQARGIAALLARLGIESRLEIIKTKGDRIQDLSFDKIEGKGFFTKEIEEALLSGQTDVAVHSFKDLPTDSPADLVIAAIPEREDPRDCLVMNRAAYDEDAQILPIVRGARVGTGAVRRKAMLRFLRDDLQPLDLRGNVPTRVGRLREGKFDAVLLAQAGLHRLGLDLSEFVAVPLSPELFVPAPAQGALALQCRADHEEALEALGWLHHADVDAHVKAERALLARLEGGCHLPLGAHARPAGERGEMQLLVFYGGSQERPTPRRLDLLGRDPFELAERAYEELMQK